ncbi:MAG: RDD family protein [Myxococcaceae bacterium]|nr:RDD family protein [Myxococcaceae bacterium]MCI0671342.1 RDD family protein [Myxococcaceae bacterium]
MRPPRWRIVPDGPREAEGSPYPKASLLLRAGARAVDVGVAWGLWVLLGQAGNLAALLFILLADGMLEGQSVGKRIFGVKVMHLPTRSAARHRDSVIRNAPLGLVMLFGMLPSPIGGVAFGAGLLVIGGVEAWRAVRDPLGQRRGDHWAQTQVVDAKEVAGATVAERRQAAAAQQPQRMLFAARRRSGGLRRRQRCASR